MKIGSKYKPDNISDEEWEKLIDRYLWKSSLNSYLPVMEIDYMGGKYVGKKNKLNKGKRYEK